MFNFMKGVALVLIVMRHTCYPSGFYLSDFPIIDFLDYAVLPFFLIATGYSMKPMPEWKYVKSQASRLLIPYIICGVVTVIICFPLCLACGHSPEMSFLKTARRGLSFAIGASSRFSIFGQPLMDIAPAWFLLMMFFSTIIFNVLLRKLDGKKLLAAVIGCALAGQLLIYFFPIPTYVEEGIAAVGYLYLGRCLKKNKELLNIGPEKAKFWILLALAVVCFILPGSGLTPEWANEIFISYVGTGIAGLSMILTGLFFDRFYFPLKFTVGSWGRLSLFIICVHTVESTMDAWNDFGNLLRGIGTSPWAIYLIMIVMKAFIIWAGVIITKFFVSKWRKIQKKPLASKM